ncbi:MAG: helix-turn-helix domain-containing protein [Planctomycetaceae bacterium]|nr:helix-turn-helix domain-containing protein [Planctomycetaceae bacterium]
MTTTRKKPLATINEAAEYLNRSRRTVERMMAAGDLTPVKVHKSRMVKWSQLKRIVSGRK